MLQLAGTEATEDRFWWVPAGLRFVFTCRKEETEGASISSGTFEI